nr:hypothetical protein [Tanacetum cinerariifolium]
MYYLAIRVILMSSNERKGLCQLGLRANAHGEVRVSFGKVLVGCRCTGVAVEDGGHNTWGGQGVIWKGSGGLQVYGSSCGRRVNSTRLLAGNLAGALF